MKKHLSNIFLFFILIAGLSLLLYPTFSDWWNTRTFDYEISEYTANVASAENSEIDDMLEEAHRYNRRIQRIGNRFYPISSVEYEEYAKQLSYSGSQMMGYISIPKIRVSLPIFHGTDEIVLSAGIGHLEGTSLPIGGEGTHSVLSGHRGLPSAKLFSDLDRLEVGDFFIIEIMGMTLTYEIDQILVVLPQEVGDLQIMDGEDYCTLVTCTPYGINSHRILARGKRIENLMGDARINADAIQIRPVLVAPFVAMPILFVLLIMVFVDNRKKYND